MKQFTVVAPKNTSILPQIQGKKVKALSLFSKKEQAQIRKDCISVAVTDGREEFLVQPDMEVPSHYAASRTTDNQIVGVEKATGG